MLGIKVLHDGQFQHKPLILFIKIRHLVNMEIIILLFLDFIQPSSRIPTFNVVKPLLLYKECGAEGWTYLWKIPLHKSFEPPHHKLLQECYMCVLAYSFLAQSILPAQGQPQCLFQCPDGKNNSWTHASGSSIVHNSVTCICKVACTWYGTLWDSGETNWRWEKLRFLQGYKWRKWRRGTLGNNIQLYVPIHDPKYLVPARPRLLCQEIHSSKNKTHYPR